MTSHVFGATLTNTSRAAIVGAKHRPNGTGADPSSPAIAPSTSPASARLGARKTTNARDHRDERDRRG